MYTTHLIRCFVLCRGANAGLWRVVDMLARQCSVIHAMRKQASRQPFSGSPAAGDVRVKCRIARTPCLTCCFLGPWLAGWLPLLCKRSPLPRCASPQSSRPA